MKKQSDPNTKFKDVDVQSLRGDPNDRFHYEKKKFNDVWAAILFFAHFLVLGGIAIGGFAVGYSDPANNNNNTTEGDYFNPIDDGLPFSYTFVIGISVSLCGIVGVLFGSLWLTLMKKFPRQMIIIGFFFSAMLITLMAISILVLGFIIPNWVLIIIGAFFLLFNIIFVILFFLWRKRIEFSAQLLSAIIDILTYFKGTFLISAIGMIAYMIWFFVWMIFVLAFQQYVEVSPYLAGLFIIFALFSWFWTCQVIKNVVHTTITGTVGMWYFRDEIPDGVVKGALIRACTTSFGSICFGSLLVAIVTTIRVISESMARDSNNNIFLRLFCCMVACCLRIFEDLLNYFNRYAYTFIAIYGEPYIPSGKRAFRLFAYYGLDAVMNDSLIGSVIMMGCFLGSFLCAFTALGISVFFELVNLADATTVGISFLLGFLTGYGVIVVCLETVDSAIVGLFVSTCEEPHRLKHKIPKLWNALHERYASKCSNLFSHSEPV